MRILIIRRDNIGDLVCTTPLIRQLRQALPDAFLAAYVNSYNQPVLEGNPDLNAVHAYTKGKHFDGTGSLLGPYWARLKLLWHLRQQQFDDVMIAEPVCSRRLVRLARLLAPRRIIGFAAADGTSHGLTHPVPRSPLPGHEVKEVFRLLSAYGVTGEPPPARVMSPVVASPGVIGLHISARKPSQRWPVILLVALARRLCQDHGANIRLFWAPGPAADPRHPGDDDKAATILAELAGLPVVGVPTTTLRGLIDGLAACESVICSDGGAMHLAAGLGKPIVCLFGKSDAVRWHPWGVPYRLLQKPGENVADIGVDEVLAAWLDLRQTVTNG